MTLAKKKLKTNLLRSLLTPIKTTSRIKHKLLYLLFYVHINFFKGIQKKTFQIAVDTYVACTK